MFTNTVGTVPPTPYTHMCARTHAPIHAHTHTHTLEIKEEGLILACTERAAQNSIADRTFHKAAAELAKREEGELIALVMQGEHRLRQDTFH